MSKRNVGSIIASMVLSLFFVGILWDVRATDAQQQTSLETRVQNLEGQVQRLEVFKLRYETWSMGFYSAVLYSSDGKRIVFENNTSFLKESYSPAEYTCVCRIGDYKHVSLYDGSGKLLDSAEFFSRLKVGDYVVAWYTKTAPASQMPTSPGPIGISPFYWNKESGLAVGILRIDGTMVVQ